MVDVRTVILSSFEVFVEVLLPFEPFSSRLRDGRVLSDDFFFKVFTNPF